MSPVPWDPDLGGPVLDYQHLQPGEEGSLAPLLPENT